jgi:hypothetical protein
MRGKSIVLAVILLMAIVFVPCARNETVTETETIELDGFTITLSDPKVDFPDSIEFKIEAESDAEITDITLQYRMDKVGILPVTSVVFPAFEAGEKTSAEWKWDMTQTGGLPPGADLTYWWSIEDASGHKAETPGKALSFDDGRHQWKETQSASFNLYWYKGDSRFAQRLVEAGEDSLIRLEEDIGAKPERTIEVYVYGSTKALQGSMIYPQEWYGGVAFPQYGSVVLGVSRDQISEGETTMAHEMAHLVVHQATMNGYGIELPTWLSEGLATYAEGEQSFESSGKASALSSAVKGRRLDSVQSLASSFPAQTAAAVLAYAESYSLVEYLLDHWGGKANMLDLLGAIRDGSGYEEAIQDVYGLTISQLDSLWRQHLTAGAFSR